MAILTLNTVDGDVLKLSEKDILLVEDLNGSSSKVYYDLDGFGLKQKEVTELVAAIDSASVYLALLNVNGSPFLLRQDKVTAIADEGGKTRVYFAGVGRGRDQFLVDEDLATVEALVL